MRGQPVHREDLVDRLEPGPAAAGAVAPAAGGDALALAAVVQGPPESPGSAQTLVRVSSCTTSPPTYCTVSFVPSSVPQCQPVVVPERQTEDPVGASAEPRTRAFETVPGPDDRLRPPAVPGADPRVAVLGERGAWKVPITVPSQPDTVAPAEPQWPAVTDPPWTEKPREQRALPVQNGSPPQGVVRLMGSSRVSSPTPGGTGEIREHSRHCVREQGRGVKTSRPLFGIRARTPLSPPLTGVTGEAGGAGGTRLSRGIVSGGP